MRPPVRSLELTQVTEWNDGAVHSQQDSLAAEEPLEIRVDGTPLTVTMRTPGNDLELAAGFLLTEGIIESRDQLGEIRAVAPDSAAKSNVVEVQLKNTEFTAENQQRNFFAASSCGICGKASIEAIRRRGLRAPKSEFRVSPEVLCGLPETLRADQPVFDRTGGLHAAALFDGRGNLIELREDIGRHNAVDKLAGWALLENRMPLSNFIMLVSGLKGMIDIVKGMEPEVGFGSIMQLSEVEAFMRESQIKRTKTVCTYCGVGCTFDIWTKDRQILKVEPLEGPANGVSTCIKGKFGWDYVNSPNRLTRPLVREDDKFREATWDEALDLIARRFTEIKGAYGPDALAFISSSKCTNGESYLMQKLARAVIGTNNMDNCSRYCQAPATTGLFRTVGYGGDSGSIKDIEQAGLVVIIGSNTAESHPVLAKRVKRAHKLRGQKLIVSDLRENGMARRADVYLHPRPGTDLIWLSAVTRYIFDHGLANQSFIDKWVNKGDEYRKSLEPFTLEMVSERCGIPQEVIIKVAHMIAEAEGVCILWAMGWGRSSISVCQRLARRVYVALMLCSR